MEKFLIPILCVLFVACGNSQEIVKQDSATNVVQQKLDTIVKNNVTDPIKSVVSDTKNLEVPKPTLPIIADEKAPEMDNLVDPAKVTKPMKKVAAPDPQIMKVPKPSIVADEKAPEMDEIEPKKIKPSITTTDHSPWNNLLQKHVTKEGVINYKGFIADKIAFKAYLETIATSKPTEAWSINQKLAYWMNAYNAFTVKLIIDNYPIKSIKDIKDPWDQRFFKIGEKWYNLNEIEHKILRKMGDPRIHFGINCASFSCPPLLNKAFTGANVNTELNKLAVTFVNDTKRNEISANAIKVSKIFQWFAKDFKTNGSLIDFLNQYSNEQINSNAKKGFKDYDWNLNE